MFEKDEKFDETDNVLFIKLKGNVSIENILQSADELEQNKTLPRVLRIIEDARDANVKLSVRELHLIEQKIRIVAKNFDSIRHAVIHSTPINTALSFMMSDMIKSSNYNLKVFSTMEGAKDWVKLFV
jgi:phage-related protein